MGRLRASLSSAVSAFLLVLLLANREPVSTLAAPGDVSITVLSCDSSPEYVRIRNFGSDTVSLSGFRLQSDPNQEFHLAAYVASISPGQTLEFQSGSGSADSPGAGIYKLTGQAIYRNGDPTDYARLVRSDGSSHQVNCGSVPPTPTPTPTPTPPGETPMPSGTPGPGGPKGDMDCNHSVDAVDALRILRHVAGLNPNLRQGCDPIGPADAGPKGDIDCNGDVDAVDALRILRYVAGLNPNLPPGCPAIGQPV